MALRTGTDIPAAANGTTATYTGVISRNGVVLMIGDLTNAGTVVLSGNNTYNGGTEINPGTLVAAVGNLVDDRSLIFASTGTVTFGTVIGGPGNVIQDGTGTTILSGRNTYRNGTVIDLGTLLVDNAQALGTGDVTVNGGVLAADPQPINVFGNYTQNAGGPVGINLAADRPGCAMDETSPERVAGGTILVCTVYPHPGLNGRLHIVKSFAEGLVNSFSTSASLVKAGCEPAGQKSHIRTKIVTLKVHLGDGEHVRSVHLFLEGEKSGQRKVS
jgi:autotransporter-associated beta strand protein